MSRRRRGNCAKPRPGSFTARRRKSAAMVANVRRAIAITARLNRLTFDDADAIRALFSELIGKKVDESFLLIPPFYTTGGDEIRIGRNVFVNQNCTFYDLGGLDIARRCPDRAQREPHYVGPSRRTRRSAAPSRSESPSRSSETYGSRPGRRSSAGSRWGKIRLWRRVRSSRETFLRIRLSAAIQRDSFARLASEEGPIIGLDSGGSQRSSWRRDRRPHHETRRAC